MNDDRTVLRLFRNWIFGIIIGILLIAGGTTVISSAFNLAWFPWQIKMQTGMIRNSNSYVTTQQTALRRFRTDYEDASTDGQRAAISRQMHEIADLIPQDVQADIRDFLTTH